MPSLRGHSCRNLSALFPRLSALFPRVSALFLRLSALFPRLSHMFPRLSHMFPRVSALFPRLSALFPRYTGFFSRRERKGFAKGAVFLIKDFLITPRVLGGFVVLFVIHSARVITRCSRGSQSALGFYNTSCAW